MDQTNPKTIVIIEDDPALAMGLCDALEFEGFHAVHAATGQAGLGLVASSQPNCIILDLMLPDINGYQVCEQIRKRNTLVPIIILSARSQEADKIRGLDAGADDYVTKPFSVGELVARIRAIFRRGMQTPTAAKKLEIGDAIVDVTTHSLQRGRENAVLSFYEVELLKLLYEHIGQPVSREEILNKVWGISVNPTNRTVDNFVAKLRKKIEPDRDHPRYILTLHGFGYKLVK